MVPPWRSFKRTSSWLLFGAVDFFSNTWQRLGELGVAVALYPTSDLRTMRQHCGCEGVRRRCGTYWYQADHFEGWASKLLMSAFEKVFFFLSRLRRLAFSWIFFVSSLKFWVFSLLKKVSIILPGRGAWLQWGGWTHLPHIQGPSGMHSVTCIGWQEEVGPPAPGWLLWCPGVVLWRISCNQDYDMKWFRVE